jgi:hypothetical protein
MSSKPIKISIENSLSIEAALLAVNGKASTHTYTSPLQDEDIVSCGGCGVFTHERCAVHAAHVFIDGVCPHDPRPWVVAARAARRAREA